MALATSRVLASGCAALLVFSIAVGAQADPIVVAKHENLLHQRNVTAGTNFSPFFTHHTDGTAFLPADGWAPTTTVQAAAPGTSSTTPKKSFSFIGDSTAAGNWTDGNGIPAGITLTFDAEFTISALQTEAGMMLTVGGLSTENASGRGIGVTVVAGPTGVDDINNGRGLAFSAVTVSNVDFDGTLADPGYTFTPGGVSGFGAQVFESGQFNEGTQGMTLTHSTGTIGFGQALVGSGTTAAFGNLKMDLGFGPYHTGTPPVPPNSSSAFPRQSGPYTMVTTHGTGSTFRGISLGYDVTYDISVSAEEDADFDGDGDVDGADFLTWQRGVGVGTDLSTGDANDDNVVDGDDLDIWKGQFDSATVASAPVPEPASAVLALAAAIGAAAVRHGRRVG